MRSTWGVGTTRGRGGGTGWSWGEWRRGCGVARVGGWAKRRLPEYMVPSAFVMVEELPLLPNGKVDRKRLPKWRPKWSGVKGERGREYVAPRTEVEWELTGIWEELLGVERVGVEEDFFELGGHSLLATQLVSRVRERLHVELPLRELFVEPTVSALAEAIERASTRPQAPPIR